VGAGPLTSPAGAGAGPTPLRDLFRSHDIFKILKITDYTSEMMQDRDSCNRRLTGNRISVLSNQTSINDVSLKFTFAD